MNVCKKHMKFSDCELAILRNAVDKAEKIEGAKKIANPQIQEIISIVESFLRKKKLICYGGTAINNILPVKDQFYDKNIEIPDYDFFSNNALQDAKELADIYYNKGFEMVEAKAGSHYGTYKVFVNYIPVADITQLVSELFKNIKKTAIKKYGIYYCPPNFLRMSMYLELSRPAGDVSRWEKVLKRLILLNDNYPLTNIKCAKIDYQRKWELKKYDSKVVFDIIQETAVDLGLVFFGGYANILYSKYMPKNLREKIQKIPDFDLLSYDPLKSITIIKERLMDENIKNVKIIKHKEVGEIVAKHYELTIDDETCCFIYEPIACHSYNVIHHNDQKINIASIDTILSFYLAFIYTDRKYYDDTRLLCMADALFNVIMHNRLEQKGILKRFTLNCYGKQHTLEDIKIEKAEKYEELKNKKNSKEYEEWFLKYIPGENNKKLKKRKTIKNKPKTDKSNKTIHKKDDLLNIEL